MDTIEVARQQAAELHADVARLGRLPESQYEFAVEGAKACGLDVERAAPGAANLRGGKATLVPADMLILHQSVGSAFDQAFLVAHEVGHFLLGDAVAEPVLDSDPARPAESCPTGADRVVDYGRRQRREVQMDLFAREFLLPRELLKRLHLDDGLTASDIAARFAAPFDVVAQQLFDALLLPPVTAEAAQPGPEKALNEAQRVGAEHRGEAYLLSAGPGTGKTQTLVARLEGLLDDGVDPRRILVLTFSNRAAGEMADRITRKRGTAAAAMWIGTFHAFGLDVVRRFHDQLGLSADPRMMDRTEAAELLEDEFPRLGLRHYRNIYDPTPIIDKFLAAFSRAKDEVVDHVEYADLAANMERVARTDEERRVAQRAGEVARAYAAYEALKRREKCIDFGDLVSLPVSLLETNPAVRRHFEGLYEHVLVDEYQDVNRASVRLLKALCGDGRNLWTVGDTRQSIYRFRGASSFNMGLFTEEDFPDGARGYLTTNYRSVSEVVDAFSTFATRMQAPGTGALLVAERGASGRFPELRTFDNADTLTAILADAIDEMRRDGHAYSDQAVLCTGNARLAEIGRGLERLGVPVLFLGSLFERPEVKELLSILSILVDRRAMGLVRTACRDDFGMSLGDVHSVVRHLRGTECEPVTWMDEVDAIADLSDEGAAGLAGLRRALDGFDQTSSPWTVIATLLLDRTRWAAEIAGSNQVADRARGIAIWQFLNFLRVQPRGPGLPVTRLLNRVRRLIRLGDDRDLRQLPAAAQGIDAVRLMTVHGAKGLEFPVVHFPGMNKDTIPLAFRTPECPPPTGMIKGGAGDGEAVLRAGHVEEQECLFYVALSRARDRLLLYAATRTTKGNRPLSPFLDSMGPGLRRHSVVTTRHPVPALEDGSIALEVEGPLSFDATKLTLYETCPRRFLYTHVLELGGRRVMTAFMQMHDAARIVVQDIISECAGGSPPDLEARLGAAFATTGLAPHGQVEDYRSLALAMVRYFLATRAGHRCELPQAISLTVGGEQVVVTPDDILVRPDGRYILRRVRTGHGRKADLDDTAARAFAMAAAQAYPGAVVDIVYLADEAPGSAVLELSDRKLASGRQTLADTLVQIRRGEFPTNPSERTCPGCPAFFVCGSTPSGVLKKKF